MTNEASKPNRRKLTMGDFSALISVELFSIEKEMTQEKQKKTYIE